MKRLIIYFCALFACSFGLACGGGDSAPGFPVGTWELSEISFSSQGATVTMPVSQLPTLSLIINADNTLTATGTGSQQDYTWQADDDNGTFSIVGGQNFNAAISQNAELLSYKAYAISDMSSTTGTERQIAEFAASTFIQNRVAFEMGAPLDVHFTFTKL